MRKRLPTLRARVALAVGSLVLAALSLAAIGIWGVVRIHADSGAAVRGYAQLREVYQIGVHLEDAKRSLQSSRPDRGVVLRDASLARMRIDTLETQHGWLEESREVGDALKRDVGAIGAGELEESTEAVDRAMGRLSMLSSQVRATIEKHEAFATKDRRLSLTGIAGASTVIVLITVIVALLHYRGVTGAVDRLSRAVRHFASGNFDERIAETGHAEFAAVGRDFNQMASELQSLYAELERKVAEKSRELVRSERLASVGYLGAGVAHEINNPLGIIAAYGERALQRLRRGDVETSTREQIEQTLAIICDEAFRAKEITDRLLSLVRPGDENRRPISIAGLVQEVVNTVVGLPQFANARFTLECSDPARALCANVSDTEIKQVLLNLLVNAIEAFPLEDRGNNRVRVTIEQPEADWIEVSVHDTGRGMDDQTLARVFEPFFSRQKDHRGGTGLGLSICHAIVESHHGKLTAASAGVGKGSCFVMSLPAVRSGVKHVHA
jgi:signal transduction histidine kinase